MAVKVTTFASTLLVLARELGNARMNGNEAEIEAAQKRLDAYEKLCLESDGMVIGGMFD